jgi:hypothetical protein
VLSTDRTNDILSFITRSSDNPEGISIRELAEIRTDMRSFIAASVAEIVGEQSGRITDRELAIAQEALRLLETGATVEQMQGALNSVLSLNFLEAQLNFELASGKKSFDLINEDPVVAREAQQAAISALDGINFLTDPTANAHYKADLIEDLEEQQRLIQTVGGIDKFRADGGRGAFAKNAANVSFQNDARSALARYDERTAQLSRGR